MPGLPNSLAPLSLLSQNGTVNTAVSSPPSVMVSDINGFPVPGVAVSFGVVSGGGSISGGGVTNGLGIASLSSWTLGPSVGANSVSVSVGGLSLLFTATAAAPAATTIAAVTATSQQGLVGQAVPATPQVRVTTANGAPVEGVQITWAVTAGGGSLGLVQVLTDAAGISRPQSWTLGPTPGTNTVTATKAGLTGSPVTFSATGLSPGPTAIAAASTAVQTAQASSGVSSPPSVKVTDAQGLPVAGVTVSFAVSFGGGSISPASAITNGSGIASASSWTLGAVAGTLNNGATASVAGLAGSPVSFLATATAGAPGTGVTPSQMAANSTTSLSARVGSQVGTAPSVVVKDAGNVVVPGIVVTFTIISGSGQLSSSTVVTNGSGIATLNYWILGPVPGTNNNVLHATVAGLTGSPVVFTATATAGAGQLTPAAYTDVLYVPAVEKLYASGGAQSVGSTRNIVRVFDARTRSHLTDITVSQQANGLVLANGKVYVAHGAGNISVIDTQTDTLLSTITVAGQWMRGVYVPSTDRVVFVQLSTGTVIQVDPSTDTQSTLATVAGVGFIAYSSSNNRLYMPTSSNTVAVLNASTGALVTTIVAGNFQSNNSAMVCVYAGTSPDGVYVTATNSGSQRRIAVITPATNSVRGYVNVPATTLRGATFVADTGKVYAVEQTNLRASALTIDAVTDTFERADGVQPSTAHIGGYLSSCRTLFTWGGSGNDPLMAFNVDSHSPAIRTSITDSRVDAPQLDVMESRPFAPGDLVTFRRNAEGGYRVRLEWPTMIAELGNLRRERWMADDTVRGERNYVTNPWARTWNSSFQAPGWVLNSTRESRYYSRDNSNWTAFTAQANGAGNTVGSITLTLRNMTPGDVLEPGDYFTSIGRYVVARAVVNGSGIIAVTLHGALSGTIVDGTSVTVRRPPQPTWMAGLTEGVVVSGATGASAESGVTFAVPYYEGLTTLWCTVECYVWVAAGALAPSTALALVTRVTSATTVAVTPSLDATVYSDPSVLLGPFILSYRHTLTPGDVMSLAARLTLPPDGSAGSLYIRRFQATLGPEADIAPPFEFNADAAALFHAGQRTLRDRGNAPVQYTVKVIESDDAPFTPGGAVDLRHPAPGIVATPRTLAVTRTLTPDLESDDVPVVRLDNLPPSLSRRLSSSGVS